MTIETITFQIPEHIARGLASGEFKLFGGVVRDGGGHVVKMLEPVARGAADAARRNPRIAVAAVAVAVVAGAAIFVAKRTTKKARLTRQLETIDEQLQGAQGIGVELTREQLTALLVAIDDFLRLAAQPGFKDVKLTVEPARVHDLILLAEALQSFSQDLARRLPIAQPVPELPALGDNAIVPTLALISEQLAYQQRHWS